jgi:ketosteroid isomerase-like protein
MAASPEQERNVALAKAVMEVWMSGDVEAARAMLTEDVEVYVPTEIANAGTFRGHDEWLRWAQTWDEAWSEFSYEFEEALPVGDRHVVDREGAR